MRVLMTICSSCGRTIPQGTICQCRKHDGERREGQRAFYDSQAWRKTRAAVKARALGCDEYLGKRFGRLVPGELVHHIIPADERPDKALELSNLIYVSKATHERIHAVYKQGGARKKNLIRELEKCASGDK